MVTQNYRGATKLEPVSKSITSLSVCLENTQIFEDYFPFLLEIFLGQEILFKSDLRYWLEFFKKLERPRYIVFLLESNFKTLSTRLQVTENREYYRNSFGENEFSRYSRLAYQSLSKFAVTASINRFIGQ